MNKSQKFIEDRIRWKSHGYDLSASKTYFNEVEDDKLDIDIPADFGKFVLVSSGCGASMLVVCIYGIIVKTNDQMSAVKYTDINDVTDEPMKTGERKSDLARFLIKLNSGEEITAYLEPGKPAFAILNILKMLIQLS